MVRRSMSTMAREEGSKRRNDKLVVTVEEEGDEGVVVTERKRQLCKGGDCG